MSILRIADYLHITSDGEINLRLRKVARYAELFKWNEVNEL